jgi:hypothetical protein
VSNTPVILLRIKNEEEKVNPSIGIQSFFFLSFFLKRQNKLERLSPKKKFKTKEKPDGR